MKEKCRIKAIAIAKDEAAYIPEWVHHHLYFGFDNIEVIINRTKDNSVDVLNKIKSKHSNLEFSYCDWVDLCNPGINIKMQEIAYAQACAKAKEEGFTHVLLIDIDEFWTPKDFKTNIHDFLENFPEPSSISFNWMCELGSGKEFDNLPRKLTYFVSSHLKTLSAVNEIKEIRIHTPEYISHAKHFMANGEKFSSQKNAPQFHSGNITHQENFFIVHRLYRSEMEYVALLYRGNPDSKYKGVDDIKLNRHGYNFNQGTSHEISFPNENFEAYMSGFENFVTNCNLVGEINMAQTSVRKRAAECLEVAKKLNKENVRVLQQVFNGCKNKEIAELLEAPRKIVSCIDVVKKTNKDLSISGWAFLENALTELKLTILSLDTSQQTVSKAKRGDVPNKFPGAPVDCGFDIRAKMDEHVSNEKQLLTVRIKEADLIKCFHNTFLFYDAEQQLLRHGSITDLRIKSWLKPVYSTALSGEEVLSILVDNESYALGADGGKIKAINVKSKISKNFRFFKIKSLNEQLLVITHGECYTGAAPGGDVYFNRDEAKDWEFFTLAPSPIGVLSDLTVIV